MCGIGLGVWKGPHLFEHLVCGVILLFSRFKSCGHQSRFYETPSSSQCSSRNPFERASLILYFNCTGFDLPHMYKEIFYMYFLPPP